MKYFAEFKEDGERMTTYAADGMPYSEADIREQFPQAVEISAEDQALYVAGGYIRGEDGRPIERPQYEPTPEEITASQLAALDAEYQAQFAELAQALGLANLDNNTELISELQEEYAELKAEYQVEREAIINGN